MRYRTSTNAGEDSAGYTWGLEGDNLFILLGAALVGFVSMMTTRRTYMAAWPVCVGVGLLPIVLAVVYVYGFRNGKRRHYFGDCMEFMRRGGLLGRMRFDVGREVRRAPVLSDGFAAGLIESARARTGTRTISRRLRL